MISQKQITDLRNQVQALENTVGLPESNENVIIEIHKFLDYLNHAWDHDFDHMKSFIYPTVWKFGLGYSDFAHTNAVLSLYPILYTKNITQIKKFADSNSMSLNDLFKLYYFSEENPILQRPSEFAYETIKEDVFKFLEHHKLESINNTLISERAFFFYI
ncbi:MAG: hypothetical protein IPJ32_10545 [Sphingobacteriaceae bacterium]|nr:hypothetical protein [Sphingobacteriaceae bacterium]